MAPRTYAVYVMASRSRRLYVGVTGNLMRRVFEHKAGAPAGFTSRYRVARLVYFETTDDIRAAIAREKEIKRWSRARKIALVETTNLGWRDLAESWGPGTRERDPSLRSG